MKLIFLIILDIEDMKKFPNLSEISLSHYLFCLSMQMFSCWSDLQKMKNNSKGFYIWKY